MSRLVTLYPRTWRERYEDEFLALLSERPPDPLDRLDILRGAIDARLHPQVQGSPVAPETPVAGSPWPIRAGWLTLAGGILWIATLVVAINGPIVVDSGKIYRDAAAAMPLFFAAVMLLGVGVIAVVLQMPDSARAARAAVYVSSMAGLLWAFAPWFMWAGIVAFAGLLVVGFGAWRAGRWSSGELAILVTGVGLGWAPILAFVLGLWVPPAPDADLQFLILVPLVSAWVVVGTSLVRAPRRRVSLDPPSA
jgi:hypothetical protein